MAAFFGTFSDGGLAVLLALLFLQALGLIISLASKSVQGLEWASRIDSCGDGDDIRTDFYSTAFCVEYAGDRECYHYDESDADLAYSGLGVMDDDLAGEDIADSASMAFSVAMGFVIAHINLAFYAAFFTSIGLLLREKAGCCWRERVSFKVGYLLLLILMLACSFVSAVSVYVSPSLTRPLDENQESEICTNEVTMGYGVGVNVALVPFLIIHASLIVAPPRFFLKDKDAWGEDDDEEALYSPVYHMPKVIHLNFDDKLGSRR
uniref:Uncharacterized protein n=1 Tax=Phaeomonas parva TaxID=124430 RepID=A0A7S1TUI2_9STRA|mmetsp:Transcript_1758/g.4994  ORF Transcript_1758/g.4994 Transcript_1758/m.4994 type:complete len:264 (+) Transcript_1758:322-1113(+)